MLDVTRWFRVTRWFIGIAMDNARTAEDTFWHQKCSIVWVNFRKQTFSGRTTNEKLDVLHVHAHVYQLEQSLQRLPHKLPMDNSWQLRTNTTATTTFKRKMSVKKKNLSVQLTSCQLEHWQKPENDRRPNYQISYALTPSTPSSYGTKPHINGDIL